MFHHLAMLRMHLVVVCDLIVSLLLQGLSPVKSASSPALLSSGCGDKSNSVPSTSTNQKLSNSGKTPVAAIYHTTSGEIGRKCNRPDVNNFLNGLTRATPERSINSQMHWPKDYSP